MTTTINASNSGSGGLVQTADASGVLALQTAGTTAVTISAAQVVTFANALAVASGGTGVTSSTGTGSVVLSTSPTLITPLLGTPTSGTLTNCTFPTLNQNTTGSAATVTGNATGSTFGFNSGYGSVATAYGCRAWVSFTGSTAAIRGSANVSSITRNGTGNYVVNYSTAMPDTNYSAVASCSGQGSTNGSTNCILVNASAGGTNVAPTTTATTLFCYHPGNQVSQDTAYINFAVFR